MELNAGNVTVRTHEGDEVFALPGAGAVHCGPVMHASFSQDGSLLLIQHVARPRLLMLDAERLLKRVGEVACRPLSEQEREVYESLLPASSAERPTSPTDEE